MHGDDGVRISPGRKSHAELARHDASGGWRRALGKPHRERPIPGLAVIVAHGPTAGAADRICRGQRGSADLEDAHQWDLLVSRDEEHTDRAADQTAPKDKPTARK